MNELKSRVRSGEVCVGGWLTTASGQVAEALASCGFDWLAVDMEHGAAGLTDVESAFVACERHGVAPLVRLPSGDPILARRVLDLGAHGVIVPQVENAGELNDFIGHLLYPPRGRRGVALGRFNAWGDRFAEYFAFEPLIAAQIESPAGVEHSHEIAALEAVDVLFLGPYDLSAGLGAPGDFASDRYAAAVESVRSACRPQNTALGLHQVAPDGEELRQRIAEGFRFLAYGTDMIALRHALREVRQLRNERR